MLQHSPSMSIIIAIKLRVSLPLILPSVLPLECWFGKFANDASVREFIAKKKKKKSIVCVKVCHAGLIIGLNYGTEILNLWAQSVPLSIELLAFKTQQLKAQQCMLSLHASVPFLLFLVCTTILKSFFRPLITAVCIALHLSASQRKLWLFRCLQVYSVFHF